MTTKEEREMLYNMTDKYYDLCVLKNPNDVGRSMYFLLKDKMPIKYIKHIKLISVNGSFTGEDMRFIDDNGALLIIPFCMIVYMTPCASN